MKRVRSTAASTILLLGSLTLTPRAGAVETPGTLQVVSDLAPQVLEVVPGSVAGKTDRYIVRLDGAPLASYHRGIAGLPPPGNSMGGRLDLASPANRAYLEFLDQRRADVQSRIEAALGRPLEMARRYRVALNGFSAPMSPVEAAEVARLPGVAAVTPVSVQPVDTDAGPAWIGAFGIWDGTTTGGLAGTMGEGIVIGVIDTGINPTHPSFAAVGPEDGYDHVNPLGPGNFLGVCNPGDPSYQAGFPCNDKLIGAWNFSGDGPLDNDGHGSHTAATAAGNLVEIPLVGPTLTLWFPLSGVAPHANLIAYDGCAGAGCPDDATVAAIEQAVIDGVDVINYSISSTSGPWSDPVSLAFLAATDAGIFVATSAGNDGPAPASLFKDAPWVTAAAAATHNRGFEGALVNLTGGDASPPADITGGSFTAGHGPVSIVLAGDFGDQDCLTPFAAGTWTSDQIVVCDRGTIARTAKGENVLAGGAGGLVLVNRAVEGESVYADPHVLPAVHIGFSDGLALKAWLGSGSGHSGTILQTTTTLDPAAADVLAGFSSRGPSTLASVLKPDLTAPGVSILAADGFSNAGALLSGTSMASPHLAGAAALLSALYPGWTASEIRSALMTTADGVVLDDDGVTPATPFGQGAGRIKLSTAGLAGLLLDESTLAYQNADPGLGGDPRQLNLPSFADGACVGSCAWSRTVSNPLPVATTWAVVPTTDEPMLGLSVSPHTLSLAPGGSGSFTLEADCALAAPGGWLFGGVELWELDALAPDAHLPLAVLPSVSSGALLLTKSVNAAAAATGDTLSYQIEIKNLSDATSFSLVDPIPDNATYVPASAAGLLDGNPIAFTYEPGFNRLTSAGSMNAPRLEIIGGSSPYGYVSLSDLGVGPLSCSSCDEGAWSFGGLDFSYDGVHYDSLIMSVNGTIEAGTASGVASSYTNVSLPDAAPPNNLLAPFWTDLDLTGGGNCYIATLSDGTSSWYVAEWAGVPEWDQPGTAHTFQVWIEVGTDNIDFVYGGFSPDLPGSLTVGVEDSTGTTGDSYYYDGTGTPPAVGEDLTVSVSPGSTGSFTYQVQVGSGPEPIVNIAELTLGATTLTAAAVTVVNADCLRPIDRTVAHQTVDGTETIVACGTLTVEQSEVRVAGNAILCAGRAIILGEGFRVDSGGSLRAVVDPTLGCN
jgi:uncharacterized repeat protein (TIGR01451 family)